MLKQRILTAIPLAILVIWGMLTQPVDVIFYALLVVIFIAAWEWAGLAGIGKQSIQDKLLRFTYAVLVTALTFVAQKFIESQPQWLNFALGVTVVSWLVAIFYMFTKGPQPDNQQVSIAKIAIGFIALAMPVLALVYIRGEGIWWLFYCLSIIWIADIGAYFSGKRFGKNKLAPQLSPGKTKEGLYGAVFATACYSFFMGMLVFELQAVALLMLLIVTALATFISVAGDLFISLLKREKNLKDTGNILPGHGGVLDRIDSVISSAPFLALMLSLVIFNG